MGGRVALPISYAVLKPFFTPEKNLLEAGLLKASDGDGESLPLPLALVRAITAEPAFRRPRESGVLRQAHRRLRRASEAPCLSPALHGVDSLGVEGRRMLAILMVPLSTASLRFLVERLLDPAEHRFASPDREWPGNRLIDPSTSDRE
jgi:CRISPR-associated protein Csx17